MTIPDELMSTLGPIIEAVASDVSRGYRRYGMQQEDGSQECWLWAAEHPNKITEWFDDNNYSPDSASRLLAKTLRRHLANYGEDLKAQAIGYNRDDLVYYSRAQVRDLLPSMFDDEAWLHPEQGNGERRQPSDPATGNNWVATLADISQAYDKLNADDRELLRMFHSAAWTNNEMAEFHGVTKQSMSDRHDRVIGRLVKLLGGPKARAQHDADCDHWVGTRNPISNSQARAITGSTYDDE